VDGAYAAVRFTSPAGGPVAGVKDAASGDDPMALLAECRLLRKDDLMVVRSSSGESVG
jgi:hypothetical protein